MKKEKIFPKELAREDQEREARAKTRAGRVEARETAKVQSLIDERERDIEEMIDKRDTTREEMIDDRERDE